MSETKLESKNLVPFADVAEANNIPITAWSALVNSLYVGAKPQSVLMVWDYCAARKLDVLKKPVHIVPMQVKNLKGQYEWRDVIFPGIAEMRMTASRTGLMAGQDEVVFGPDIDVPINIDKSIKEPVMVTVPKWAKVTAYRLDATNVPRAYTHIEFFEETVARTGDGVINKIWRKRPHGQLGKCAEAGALRKAFPEELGGQYAAEEMEGKVMGDAGAPIEGEFTTVGAASASDLEPVEKEPETAQGKADSTSTPREEAAAPAPASKPAKAAPAPPPPTEGNAPAFKIDLPGPALRILRGVLLKSKMSEADLLTKIGKDISLSNVNEALALAKQAAE